MPTRDNPSLFQRPDGSAMRFYLGPTKLSRESLQEAIVSHGGEVVSSAGSELTGVIPLVAAGSCVRGRKGLKPSRSAYVATYVSACIEAGEQLPLEPFRVRGTGTQRRTPTRSEVLRNVTELALRFSVSRRRAFRAYRQAHWISHEAASLLARGKREKYYGCSVSQVQIDCSQSESLNLTQEINMQETEITSGREVEVLGLDS